MTALQVSVIRDERDIAGSRVTPRLFATLEGDISSGPMVMEVVDGRWEGMGLSSSTSVCTSVVLNGLGLVKGIKGVEGEVKLGIVSIDVKSQVVLARNVTKGKGIGGE